MNLQRSALREACRLFGGIRAVARLAAIDDGNLSRWFKGQPMLSESKLSDLLDVLGLPGGVARRDRVLEWRMEGVTLGDYAAAFRLYFPSGGEAAAASWSQSGVREVIRRIKTADSTPEIVAITDGRVRAVVRSPSNILLQTKNMGDVLVWRGGDRRMAILDIEKGDPAWCVGPLSIEEFDRGWGGVVNHVITSEDILAVIQEENLSYEQAITRLRRSE